MQSRFLILSFFALYTIFTNVTCTKPESVVPPVNNEPPLNAADVPVRVKGKAVRSTVVGNVTSTQFLLGTVNYSFAGADGNLIFINGDPENYFRVQSDNLIEDATILKSEGAYRDVEFPVSYPMLIQEDRVHYIHKVLIPENRDNTVSQDASYFEQGTTIAGIGVTTEKDGWISEGNAYSGNVEMTLLWLSNKSAYLIDFQPGDMRGIDKDGRSVYLHPYMMAGVTVATRNMYVGGQVSPGKKINLHIPIPEEHRKTFTNLTDAWRYNKDSGLWMYVGYAIRNGDYYDLAASQTGIYAFGLGTPTVYLHARLVNRQGDPLVHAQATITPNDETAWPVAVFTDNKGEFATYVPAGQAFTLKARDICAGFSDAVVIDALTTNTWMTQIMPLDRGPMTVLEGEVKDCDNQPLKSGNLLVRFRGLELSAPVKDGKYSLSFSYCEPAPVSYSFYDSASRMVNSIERQIVLKPGTINRLPADTACARRLKYLKGDIIFTVEGQTYTMNGDEDLIYIQQVKDAWSQMSTTYMYAVSTKVNKELGFSFNSYSAGNYSLYTLVASTPLYQGYIMAWGYYSAGKINVEAVDFRTGILKGSFNSSISKGSSDEAFRNPIPITGTFDLKLK